jgi:pilus assembly protein CpaE
VMLTGWNSESLALRAMQDGAQDYIVKGSLQGPALARVLQHAIVRQKTQAGSPPLDPSHEMARVVAFLGAKGGVGNTTVACHVALELQRQTGDRVLLMDLDMAGNTIGFMLKAGTQYGIAEASEDILHLDEERWKKLIAPAGGLDVLQSRGPVAREEMQPKAERIRLMMNFARTLYHWIVVDLGRLTPLSVRLAQEVSRLYLVTTPDIVGLSQTKSTIGALLESGVTRDCLSLTLNQVPSNSFSAPEVEKALGVPVDSMLSECRRDFEDSFQNDKRLGESRKLQRQVAQLVHGISGVEVNKDPQTPKSRFSFLTGVLRGATTGS